VLRRAVADYDPDSCEEGPATNSDAVFDAMVACDSDELDGRVGFGQLSDDDEYNDYVT
jgi:hypothetical protein